MAFPATIETGYNQFVGIAARVKADALLNNSTMAAGDVSAAAILSYMDELRASYLAMSDIAGISGIGAAYPELASDATAVMDAIAATITGIVALIPKDGNGYLLVNHVDGQGNRSWRQVTPAQSAGIRTLITALIATID